MNRRAPLPRSERGFTLIEVLLAVFIFSLISIGASAALTGALRGQDRLDKSFSQLAQIDTMRSLIQADMRSMITRPNRDALGSPELSLLTIGQEGLITFTRRGRDNPGGLSTRGDIQRVSYVLERGTLIRRVLKQANPAPQSGTIDRVLVDGLIDADLRAHIRETHFGQLDIRIGQTGRDVDMITLVLTFENGNQLTQNFEVAL